MVNPSRFTVFRQPVINSTIISVVAIDTITSVKISAFEPDFPIIRAEVLVEINPIVIIFQ